MATSAVDPRRRALWAPGDVRCGPMAPLLCDACGAVDATCPVVRAFADPQMHERRDMYLARQPPGSRLAPAWLPPGTRPAPAWHPPGTSPGAPPAPRPGIPPSRASSRPVARASPPARSRPDDRPRIRPSAPTLPPVGPRASARRPSRVPFARPCAPPGPAPRPVASARPTVRSRLLPLGRRRGAEPAHVGVEVPGLLLVIAVEEGRRGIAALAVQLLALLCGEVELGGAHRVGVDEDRTGHGVRGVDVHPVVEAGDGVHHRLPEGERPADAVAHPEIGLRLRGE